MQLNQKKMETKELEEKRDDLKAQLKAVKKQIKELNSKPVDGWYTSPYNDKWMAYFVNGIMILYIDGINIYKANEIIPIYECSPNIRLATFEESNKRLTEFVNGLGYVKGVKIISLLFNEETDINNNNLLFGIKLSGIYSIELGGRYVWKSDKGFAKIISKPKFKVELLRREEDVFSFIKITHGTDVDSDELVKQIETDLNSKP